jgi:hypothetical protein
MIEIIFDDILICGLKAGRHKKTSHSGGSYKEKSN